MHVAPPNICPRRAARQATPRGRIGDNSENSYGCEPGSLGQQELRQRLTILSGTVKTVAAPATVTTARRYMPARSVCVRSLSQPTIKGLTKPAKFPTELMTAILGAAGAPERNPLGRPQNKGAEEITPAAAMDRNRIESTVCELACTLSTKA